MKTKEMLIPKPDRQGWVTVPKSGGMRVYTYWENKRTGASIALLDVPKGAKIPIRHRHASNQFMYCIEGKYEYLEPGLTLKKGTFYMNPRGNPHGPTVARSRCLLLEIYDGPHYFELPSFHTAATVGRISGKNRISAAKKPKRSLAITAKLERARKAGSNRGPTKPRANTQRRV